MDTATLRTLHRRAVLDSADMVRAATQSDLDRPTPCAGWTLDALLRHMGVQHHGFALAVSGRSTTLDEWKMPESVDDPIAYYADAVNVVLAAFDDDAVLERRILLPEFSADIDFSATQVLNFHLIDYVVHAWDVARSLGGAYEPNEALALHALTVAQMIPDGPERQRPGSPFAPGRGAGHDAAVIDQIVGLLGRSPSWPTER
jgi:uncharacterized protein (TIGR03086 family)